MKPLVTPSPESLDNLFEKYCNLKDSVRISDDQPVKADHPDPHTGNVHEEVKHISALDELMAMTGLDNVKEAIARQINYHKIMNMRKEAGRKTPERLMHMLLTGSPGTGKTTVARLIGRIFKDEGILRSGHLIEANRASLVGQWIGETERKTSELLKAASGGILFIDEIYSLTESGHSQAPSRDFGMKVIDTLMPCLSDPRSDVMIIGAGYSSCMRTFLNSNPGLVSRFPLVLEFRDFSVAELMAIAVNELKKYDFILSDEAETGLRSLLGSAVLIRNNGNARMVMTAVNNHMIPNLCDRLAKNADSVTIDETGIILPEDLPHINTLFPLAGNGYNTVGFLS